MKFGGSSVADADKIRNVARRIAAAAETGDRVVAVVSARGKTTDGLVQLANEISDRPAPREMDMLLSTGERISCALMAMALHDLGHQAVSFTGSQAGIFTDSAHTKARIVEIRADRISEALADGNIALVAGFQGMSIDDKNVTTLGRGGSDTTAVALAAAIHADVCEIYTDVPVCSRRIRGSSAMPSSCRASATRKCSRWPPWAPRSWRYDQSSSHATTTSRCTCARHS